MFLNLERLVGTLHHKADENIQVLSSCSSFLIKHIVYCELRIVCILNPFALVLLVKLNIHASLYKLLVKLLHQVEFTCKVYHRTGLAKFVYHKQRRDTCSFSHKSIISTKSRRNMNDTGTILCSYVITWDDAERLV